MNRLATDLGLDLPAAPDLAMAGIAGAVAVGAGLVAWVAGRWLGPLLADFWERRAGVRTEGIGQRMCALVRYLTAWLALTLALNVWPWPPLAALLLGLIAASSVALLIANVVRGLELARWIAFSLALVVFIAVLADAIGGLTQVTRLLDSAGFAIGSRRVSLLSVIQIGVALLALYAGVKLANRLVGHTLKSAGGLDPTQQLLAQKLAAIVIIAIAFFIGIDLAGIDLTALAVFSGALGLAVGFGLQKTVGNLFAGIILLMDRSIKPGDVIVVGETFGHVTKIGVRAVSVITRDGKEHLIPNEDLMTREVENWSYSSRDVRVHIPVGISYECDIVLAQKLMVEAAGASKRVLPSPKPTVWLRGYGDSSVDHEILVWIRDPEAGVGNVQSEILTRLWHLFKENGIEIPFPQRDIHVKSLPAAPSNEAAPPAR
ncbi:MAG: mechanosensitive ion channel family protein [Sphingosinicella sp.]|uniref:mechanosensitive ion channel family protein n=1 Tax=Sphingosinicella sp. TaxID=1917971 RepID=UPI004037B30E